MNRRKGKLIDSKDTEKIKKDLFFTHQQEVNGFH